METYPKPQHTDFNKRLNIRLMILLFTFLVDGGIFAADLPPYKHPELPVERRVRDLLQRLTLEEKIGLMTGEMFRLTDIRGVGSLGIPRLGIPNLNILHGPYGFKGFVRYHGKWQATAGTWFPVSIMLASTWNPALIEQVARRIGYEMKKAAGASANAGPSLNIIRDPRGGRSFEYFTEDPYLNGRMAVAYVKGLQSQKVMAILKHFVCNNQEHNRGKIDVKVSERALREIYLPGFRDAIREGKAAVVMAAYNKVNGIHCCEHPFLLTSVLRNDWGFQGVVLSDWGGTHSTVPTAMAGLNLEMHRERWYGKKLLAAVNQGKIPKHVIDKLVTPILRVLFEFGLFEDKPSYDKSALFRPEAVALARKAAQEGIVLLKNEGNLLPLDGGRLSSLAVIGPNGEYGPHYYHGRYDISLLQGGGSALVPSPREQVVTIFQGLKAKLGKKVDVHYAPGCYAETGCGPIPSRYLWTPDDKKQGVEVKYYLNPKLTGAPSAVRITNVLGHLEKKAFEIPVANPRPGNKERFSCEWNAILHVPATREYIFELRSAFGFAKFYLDGQLMIDHTGSRSDWFTQKRIRLNAGSRHRVRLTYMKRGRNEEIQLGWDYENEAWLKEAVELARKADAVVLAVGFSGNMEGEARDRKSLRLAKVQEDLIRSVAAVNRRCIVTLVAGSATDMRAWIDHVPAILFSGYCGQEGGHAVADILLGKVNPSGHLTITFPRSIEQYPANYYTRGTEISYDEGIFVGYRYFDRHRLEPLFPFGYGLSYSRFRYENLELVKHATDPEDPHVIVRLKVTNLGPLDGATVVQVYVSDLEASEERPPKELKAFRKVWLKSGSSATVELVLDRRAFEFWSSRRRQWVLEPGRFRILAGPHSRELPLQTEIQLP